MTRPPLFGCVAALCTLLGACATDPASQDCTGEHCDEGATSESCEGIVTDGAVQIAFALSATTATPIRIDTTETAATLVPGDLGEWTLDQLGLSDRDVAVFAANLELLLPRIGSDLGGLITGRAQRVGDIARDVQLAQATAGEPAPRQPVAAQCPNIGDGSRHLTIALSAVTDLPITLDPTVEPPALAPDGLGERTLRDIGLTSLDVAALRSNLHILLPVVEASVVPADLDRPISDIARAVQLSLQRP